MVAGYVLLLQTGSLKEAQSQGRYLAPSAAFDSNRFGPRTRFLFLGLVLCNLGVTLQEHTSTSIRRALFLEEVF